MSKEHSIIVNGENHSMSKEDRDRINNSLMFQQRQYAEGYCNGYINGILAIMTLLRVTKKRKAQVHQYITDFVETTKYLQP